MSTNGTPGPGLGVEPQPDAEQPAQQAPRREVTAHAGAQKDTHPRQAAPHPEAGEPVLDVPAESQTQPLRECVRHALRCYLESLDGHEVNDLYEMVIKEVERPLFQTVLDYAEGNQTRAARLLGMSRSTLRKKMLHYRLTRPGAGAGT